MSGKRALNSLSLGSHKRRKSGEDLTYFVKTLQECKITLKSPPEKCVASRETVYIVNDLKKILLQHADYPSNVGEFLTDFENSCKDKKIFEHYLYPNIVRVTGDGPPYPLSDSVIKILLNVPVLQTKIISYIFDKAMEVLDQPDFEPWVKMLLKSFSTLDTIESSETLSSKLMDLLDVSSDRLVRLEIISAIPDIIGDQEHDNVASKMSRILSEDRHLIQAILECLSYLCLSDEQFERLQKETLTLLLPSNAAYFANFVKFLLTPGRLTDNSYEETIRGLRRELGWSSLIGSQQELATSQVLTATAIRDSMLSSKAVTKAWVKVISSCKTSAEHKPIDIVLLLILYSLTDEKQKQVVLMMRNQIKLQIMKEDLLDEVFKKYQPILKENVMNLISLTNSLMKANEPLVQKFVSHMYMVMFSELTDCSQIIVAELLKLVWNCKQSVLNTLNILNNFASQKLSLMKPQSMQILTLLDKMDDMSLTEIRAVMDLVCALAYSVENSDIRDDVHIITIKELGTSNLSIKKQGILAGIHAVKYLSKCKAEIEKEIPDDLTLNMSSCLPEGDLREAAEMIDRINDSTEQFPEMMVFFYNELYKIVQQSTDMNMGFVEWLTNALTHVWQENFTIDTVDPNAYGEVAVSMQLRLNQDSEVDEDFAVNIAGLTLVDKREVNIEALSPLFRLIRALHFKINNGDLSSIDALLGSSILMPNIEVAALDELSPTLAKKVLDCHVHCVNWIRELLNAFVSQTDEVLKPKILCRLMQLKDLEKKIGQIKECDQIPENEDTITSQQRLPTQVAFTNKLSTMYNIHFMPLELTLLDLIQYDLSPEEAQESKFTFETLAYLLYYLNSKLETVLVPKIKRKTFLNKDETITYSSYEAEKQAQAISKILGNLISHVDLIVQFLESHILDGKFELDSLHAPKILQSQMCLGYIYNLLTIYLRWIEFKSKHEVLLKSSLRTIAKVDNEMISMEDLLTSIAKDYQKHEKYCITISSAVSLIEFIKALQEHSTAASVSTILKDMSLNFLSEQWKTLDNQLEKGFIYNQGIDSLTKVYLGNSKINDLRDIVTGLVEDAPTLRDKTSILPTLKSINKSNFPILFRNLGSALCDKIKCHLDGGLTNAEHIEMWASVVVILKSMAEIVTATNSKLTSSHYFKKSLPILNLLLSKGFPILSIEFKDHRQSVLDVLKDLKTPTQCLQRICSQCTYTALIKKLPKMNESLTDFIYKTKALLKENNCLDTLKLFHVSAEAIPKKRGRQGAQKTRADIMDVTVEDCDDDLPDDDSDSSSIGFHVDSVGISDMI